MQHDPEPLRHAASRRGDLCRLVLRQHRSRARRGGDGETVQHILEDLAVVERAPLDMPAVGKHLTSQLRDEEPPPSPPPLVTFRPIDQYAEDQERPGVLDEMVAPQMVLEVTTEKSPLRCQILDPPLRVV